MYDLRNNLSLLNDKVTGVLSETEFGIIKNSNTIEIEKSKEKLSQLDSEIINLKSDKSKQTDRIKLFEQYKDITELNKVVLDAFVTKIEIGKVNSQTSERPINIEWNLYSA